MPTRVQHKRRTTAGQAPAAADVLQGEIVLNIADGRAWTKNASNQLVEIRPKLSAWASANITDPGAYYLFLESLVDGSAARATISALPPILPITSWNWFFEDFLQNGAYQGNLSPNNSGGALNPGGGEATAGACAHRCSWRSEKSGQG